MSGTWGFLSINYSTFNTSLGHPIVYPKNGRDFVYTSLKLRNLALNLPLWIAMAMVIKRGYQSPKALTRFSSAVRLIPNSVIKWGQILGGIRIAGGAGLGAFTLLFGKRNLNSEESAIIAGRWYDEALWQACAQMVRGALEMGGPTFWAGNMVLGTIATPINIGSALCTAFDGASNSDYENPPGIPPHDNPSWPFPVNLLYLV